MAKVKQTQEEIMQHLRDNMSFLEASSASFDAGFFGEAKRLATTIRVLVHDTDRSQSLLKILNIKDRMGYLKTSHDYDPTNLLSHHGLVGHFFSNTGVSYKAFLGDGPPIRPTTYINFHDWWNEIVIVDSLKATFSRRDLILALSNKDGGGAHVDPSIDEDYAHLTRGNSVGWMVSDNEGSKPLLDIELHSRQIAYELSTSIKRHLAQQATS